MTLRKRLRDTSALAGLAAVLIAAPAFAQEPSPQPNEDQDEASELGEIVVTGSRIPQNEFTSSSPIQVLTAERAEQRGLSDTASCCRARPWPPARRR